MKALALRNSLALRSIGVRFSAPVFPGETVRTEIWRDGNEVSFRAGLVDRERVVLNNGHAVIKADA